MPLVLLTRLGLGGMQGDGTQIFSWIHVEDYFQIVLYVLENQSLHDVINCTSPNPVSNQKFMQVVRNMLGFPFGIPAPKLIIRISSKLIGIEPELILNSVNVLPKRLLEVGYEFRYPKVEKALKDLLM